jgi:hypothetical protein
MLRVFEAYAIDMPRLERLASVNEYWKGAWKFVVTIRGKHLGELKKFELEWLQKIELDMKVSQ